MDNIQVKEILHNLGIPRTTCAQLANVKNSELSAYLRSRTDVSEIKARRIEAVAQELEQLIGVVWPKIRNEVPVVIDLRAVPELRLLLDYLKRIQTQIQAEQQAGQQISA
jgi:hypothetical protein